MKINLIIIFLLSITLIILKSYSNLDRENFNNYKNYVYIHVGKTGGTTIHSVFGFKHIHHRKPKIDISKKYIISIRNPIKRLASAYNMAKSLIIYNKLGPSNKNAIDRYKKNGYYYSEQFDAAFKKFNSFNDLCEKIFSSKDANYLLTNTDPHHHFVKNMAWYLDNGNLIEKYHNNIFYVLKNETLNEDINKLSKLLGNEIEYNGEKDKRVNDQKDEYLSDKAVSNLIEYFEPTEYKTLKTLLKYNFITQEYLDYCYTYDKLL